MTGPVPPRRAGVAGRVAAAVILLLAARAVAAQEDPFADLRSEDPATRERGRTALAAADDDVLARALRDPSGLVRAAAADAAAARGPAAGPAVRAALRAALRDGAAGEAPRRAAARALGAASDLAAALDLRAALRDLPEEAAEALAALGDAGALDDLRAAALARGPGAPPEIAYARARLGDPAGEDGLVDALGGTDPARTRAAHHLLRRLTGKDHGPSVALWREETRLRRLAEGLGDRDWDRSEEVLQAVLASGPGALGDLLHVLGEKGASREARGKAALGLGLLGRAEAGPVLLGAARVGEDPWVRVYAAEALGRIAWSPAAPVLARMLVHDEDPDVPATFATANVPHHAIHAAITRALLEMGCEGALGVVVDRLSGGALRLLPEPFWRDYKVRVYYEDLASLRDFGGPGAREGFGFRPDDEQGPRRAAGARAVRWWLGRPADLAVRPRADFSLPGFSQAMAREIETLGRYKFLEMDRSRRALVIVGRPGLPHLLAALGATDEADPAGLLRTGVASVLADIGDASAVAPLRAALRRAAGPAVRSRLLVSLARLGPEGGVPEAVPFLGAATPEERAAAAEALALAPLRGAAAALRTAFADAADGDAAHRLTLAAALLGVRDTSGVAALLDGLDAADAILRRAAWERLDARLEGLGPFDPGAAPGTGSAEVRARWNAQRAAPRFRGPVVPAE